MIKIGIIIPYVTLLGDNQFKQAKICTKERNGASSDEEDINKPWPKEQKRGSSITKAIAFGLYLKP